MSPIDRIFTPDVLRRLRATQDPSDGLRDRLSVLDAPARSPDPDLLPRLLARKAVWEDYLAAALECRLLDDEPENELRGRLTSRGDAGFRSGMAECLACWFFHHALRIPVEPKPPGRPGKKPGDRGRELDLLLRFPDGAVYADVKAPYVPWRTGVKLGDDANVLGECLEEANRQFAEGVRNLLVLVPDIPTRVSRSRRQLLHAFYGRAVLELPLNPTGGAAGPMRIDFVHDGRFMKPQKPAGRPAFTRISAVLSIEEIWGLAEGEPPAHQIVVVHNVNAPSSIRISPEAFAEYPQFLEHGDEGHALRWTDGAGLYP